MLLNLSSNQLTLVICIFIDSHTTQSYIGMYTRRDRSFPLLLLPLRWRSWAQNRVRQYRLPLPVTLTSDALKNCKQGLELLAVKVSKGGEKPFDWVGKSYALKSVDSYFWWNSSFKRRQPNITGWWFQIFFMFTPKIGER